MEDIFKDFNTTGVCKLNIDVVVKKWNHLWSITEWRADNSWRIIKYARKDSPVTRIKATISHQDAQTLIQLLNLEGVNEFFKSAYTYKKPEHFKN